MPKPSRRTNYDRVLVVLEEIISVWRNNSCQSSANTAKFLEEVLEAITPGAPIHETVKKSEIASSQLQFLRDFLHTSNRHGDERDDALAASREIFGREFPDFFAELIAKRDRIIERGKIQNEDEYYLIRNFVDELEGEPDQSTLLNELYGMVDNFSVE